MGERTRRLLAWVASRQHLVNGAGRFFLFFIILAGVYAGLLLVSRLFAVFPESWFSLRTLPGILVLSSVAVLALAAAVIFARRPTPTDAARLVDTRMKTKDVFLNAARIEDAWGDFKPIVLHQAESTAEKLRAKDVVPFEWLRKSGIVAACACALAAAAFVLPQFDLLGKEEARERMKERMKILQETRKATEDRTEALKRGEPTAETSKEVGQALTGLKQTFNQAKPKETAANLKKLTDDQKLLSDLWKQLNENKLKDSMNQSGGGQQFGAKSLEKQQQWKEEMRKGDPSGLKKELEEIKTEARKLDSMEKASDRAAAQADMQKRMQDLADFMEKEMNSKPGAGAMARAMDQMGMAGVQGLSKEAMEALQESLNLSEMEAERLAQQARDLEKIQQGLKALQLAKGLNKMQALDGEQCAGCGGMEDYEKLYREMMAARGGGGEGDGEKNPGEPGGKMGGSGGVGGKGEEKDSDTDFTPEQSRSALVAGKVLLQWKTKGVSEAGDSAVTYQKQVENVKKGVSEAILREQVPPGYHDAIRKYFDSMGGKGDEPPKP